MVQLGTETVRRRRFRWFAWGLLGYTMLVILWGAYVRATGSGAGCGADWPTCQGAVVPRSPAMETLIEYTHRLTSGLAWVLAAVLPWWASRLFPRGHSARKGAVAVLVLMTTEALIGAGLVLFEMVAGDDSIARAVWMAAHLINTFLLLAAAAATAWWASDGAPVRLRAPGAVGWMLWASLAGMLVLGASGAVTALGDTLFPADSLAQGLRQDMSPSAHLFLRLRVWHPVLGLTVGALVLLTAAATAAARPEPGVRGMSWTVALAFMAQVALGFINLALLAPIWMQIVHLLMADLTWIALVLLAVATFAERSQPAAPEPAVPERRDWALER